MHLFNKDIYSDSVSVENNEYESCYFSKNRITKLKDCNIKYSQLLDITSSGAFFENNSFYEGWLDASSIHFCVFKSCTFAEFDFQGNSLIGTNFINCHFKNVDFTDNNLKGVEFIRCTFDNVTGSYNKNIDKVILDETNNKFLNKSPKYDFYQELKGE